jgi:hypothetical protein
MKEKSKINTGWHKLHPMPHHATTDQRIEWHLQHLRHCQCRTDLPEKLKGEIIKRGISIPLQVMAVHVANEIEVF